MGQVLHGSATTTEAIRRAIQHSQESLRTLARRYGINQKTVRKWKGRASVADRPTGPKEPRSTVLSVEEEAVIVAFRRYTLLPLDDCLYALQPTIPHLTRSSLHRCLQRHDISRLPDVEGDKPAKRKFKSYPIGFFHIDIAEVRTEQGKLHMFVAIDRTSKFAFVELHEKAPRPSQETSCSDWSRPYLTRSIPCSPTTASSSPRPARAASACAEIIERHRASHHQGRGIPGPTARSRRMNRTIKDATVKRFYYDSHDQLRRHLADFIAAYNFGRRLKTLKGLTPYEFICKAWGSQPERFTLDPLHQMPGLNI